MKWVKSADEIYWWRSCGRYYVCRSLAFDRNPQGHWVHLAWFKSSHAADAVSISPERRETFEQAVADCSAHIQKQRVAA